MLTAAGLLVALGLVIRAVAFCRKDLPVTSEWIGDLSQERYRPMLRLLDAGDWEFLRSQPGFDRAMAVKLRRQRCRIFQGYLQRLQADFGRAVVALKVLILQSHEDRPDLSWALLRHQLMFGWGMVLAHLRLFLYRWGIGSVDVSGLLRIFDAVQNELRSAVPLPVAA